MKELYYKFGQIVKHNLPDFLILTPLVNVIAILFGVTLHWITGGYGYLIGLLLTFLGLFIGYLIWTWLKSKRWGLGAIASYMISIVLLPLIWYDFKFLFLVIANKGFVPCTAGASCP